MGDNLYVGDGKIKSWFLHLMTSWAASEKNGGALYWYVEMKQSPGCIVQLEKKGV